MRQTYQHPKPSDVDPNPMTLISNILLGILTKFGGTKFFTTIPTEMDRNGACRFNNLHVHAQSDFYNTNTGDPWLMPLVHDRDL